MRVYTLQRVYSDEFNDHDGDRLFHGEVYCNAFQVVQGIKDQLLSRNLLTPLMSFDDISDAVISNPDLRIWDVAECDMCHLFIVVHTMSSPL